MSPSCSQCVPLRTGLASKGCCVINRRCPECPGQRPLPARTALRHDLVVGHARLERSPLRPGMQQDDGHAAWVPELIKPAAIGVAALSVALCAGALALLWLAPTHHAYTYDISGDVVVGSFFPLVGALIAVREPGNRCSWVLLSAGLVAVSAFSHEWAYDGLARPGLLPLVPVATWLAGWTFAPYWLQVTLLPVLFPDGQITSRRWRRFVVGVLTVVGLATVVAMFKPDSNVEGLGVRNPLAIGPAHVGNAWRFLLLGPVLALAFVAAPVALAALAARQPCHWPDPGAIAVAAAGICGLRSHPDSRVSSAR